MRGSICGSDMSLLLRPTGVTVTNTQENKSKSTEVANDTGKKMEYAGYSRHVTTISYTQPTKWSYDKHNHCN